MTVFRDTFADSVQFGDEALPGEYAPEDFLPASSEPGAMLAELEGLIREIEDQEGRLLLKLCLSRSL